MANEVSYRSSTSNASSYTSSVVLTRKRKSKYKKRSSKVKAEDKVDQMREQTGEEQKETLSKSILTRSLDENLIVD